MQRKNSLVSDEVIKTDIQSVLLSLQELSPKECLVRQLRAIQNLFCKEVIQRFVELTHNNKKLVSSITFNNLRIEVIKMAVEKTNKIRLSLDVTPELNKTIEDLAKKIGGSKSDVLRKSITLMELIVDYQQEGKKVGIANGTGEPMFLEIAGLL